MIGIIPRARSDIIKQPAILARGKRAECWIVSITGVQTGNNFARGPPSRAPILAELLSGEKTLPDRSGVVNLC